MADSTPVVYLLHGEDDFGIAQFIDKLKEKMGDPSLAETNTTYLEGGTLSISELKSAAYAIPFLTSRRLVIATNPTKRFNQESQRRRFLDLLAGLPTTTALILLEQKALEPKKSWLLKWVNKNKILAFVRPFPALKGGLLAKWIRDEASKHGGEITRQAAALLSENYSEDPRGSIQELNKLLAYVNYKRPVDVEDVDNLSAFASGQGDYFAMIDAIGRGDGRKALDMLHRLFDEMEPLPLFFRLVSNFRLLLLTREVLDSGGDEKSVANKLDIHPYRAKKLSAQARNLDLASLETIYRQLLAFDEQIKTGQIEANLAMDTLIAALAVSPV